MVERILFLIIVMGFTNFNLFAQDTISILSGKGGYTKDSLKTGVWRFYHPNGKLAIKGRFVPEMVPYVKNNYDSTGLFILSSDTSTGERKRGVWKYFDTNGKRKIVIRVDKSNRLILYKGYINGELRGKTKWHLDKTRMGLSFYDNGNKKDKTRYYHSGGCRWKHWDEEGKKTKGRCEKNITELK